MENIQQRIEQIRKEIASIGEFAVGTLSCSSSRYRLKNGTWKQAKPHWKFQSLGPRGKRRYIHVPVACVKRVKELVENGKRYRVLEREYARLITEASLADAEKKTSSPCRSPGSGGSEKSSRNSGKASRRGRTERKGSMQS